SSPSTLSSAVTASAQAPSDHLGSRSSRACRTARRDASPECWCSVHRSAAVVASSRSRCHPSSLALDRFRQGESMSGKSVFCRGESLSGRPAQLSFRCPRGGFALTLDPQAQAFLGELAELGVPRY